MKANGGVLIVLSLLLMFVGTIGAAEYVAKNGDTWAKVSKSTETTVQQLAKMNKINEPKDSDLVTAGYKVTYLSKDDIGCAQKWVKKRLEEINYGEGGYNRMLSAKANLLGERFEYSPDTKYPYGIRFTEVLELADKWRKSQ